MLRGNERGLAAVALIVGVHIRVHVGGGGVQATVIADAVAVFVNVLGALDGLIATGHCSKAYAKHKHKREEKE